MHAQTAQQEAAREQQAAREQVQELLSRAQQQAHMDLKAQLVVYHGNRLRAAGANETQTATELAALDEKLSNLAGVFLRKHEALNKALREQ